MARPLTWHQGLAEWLGVQPTYRLNAYYNRTLANTLLGRDDEAQEDADKAVELGYDPEALIAAMNGLRN